MVKVLPDPVTPRSTWRSCPSTRPRDSNSIAFGWSPWGRQSETRLYNVGSYIRSDVRNMENRSICANHLRPSALSTLLRPYHDDFCSRPLSEKRKTILYLHLRSPFVLFCIVNLKGCITATLSFTWQNSIGRSYHSQICCVPWRARLMPQNRGMSVKGWIRTANRRSRSYQR